MKKRLEPTFKLSFEHEKWILDGCPTTDSVDREENLVLHKIASKSEAVLLWYGHQPVPEALTEQQQQRQPLLASSEAASYFLWLLFST